MYGAGEVWLHFLEIRNFKYSKFPSRGMGILFTGPALLKYSHFGQLRQDSTSYLPRSHLVKPSTRTLILWATPKPPNPFLINQYCSLKRHVQVGFKNYMLSFPNGISVYTILLDHGSNKYT